MCVNCSPHRAGATPHPHGSPAEQPLNDDLDLALRRPISRAQLLRALGGGVAGALASGALGTQLTRAASASLPHVVLIVLDGARREYFDVPGIPHVRALMRNGTQYTNAFAGILESETPSGHVTIGTGSTPSRTGIPSFWWADPENNRISLFSPTVIRAGDMEKMVRKSGVPTLAHLVHAKAPNARVVALSGSKYYAADAIGGPDADVTMYFYGTSNSHFVPTYIPGHAPPKGLLSTPGLSLKTTHLPLGVENHLAMKLAAETFNRMRQQVTLINLPEFDWPLGHVDGGIIDPAGIKTLMHGFDHDLAMLQEAYRKAGVLGNTVFILMADHGMMPLRHRLSDTDFASAVSKAGTEIVTYAYTSAGYIWVKDSAKAVAAARKIAAMKNPYIQSVYARVRTLRGYSYTRVSSAKLLRTAGTEAANQYLVHSFNSPNAPDVVVVFAEGVGCEPGGQAGWKADHGGTSWQAQHIPLILSGPGIRSGHVSSYPARLIDIAPTILQTMGASHKGMQGIPLADALLRPSSAATHWQARAHRKLSPLVTALQGESKREVAAGV